MTTLYSFGLGAGTKNSKGDWLEVYFQQPLLNANESLAAAANKTLGYDGGNQTIEASSAQLSSLAAELRASGETAQADIADAIQQSGRPAVVVALETDAAPQSAAEGYLKLHLLSHRLVKPHGTDLSGIFGLLANVAWTDQGAIDIDELPARQLQARLAGNPISVNCIDKFPKMTDYVVPAGVRIADTSRVRLGAYIGEGTTVMHEGFVNFNAGTEGPNMIEGRVSAGVFIGAGSDLGGGCSTMGTLSGGGNIVISVGKECLVGANAGIGIPLGDRCTVEAGLYITAGTKVVMLDDNRQPVAETKARDLAGKTDLLFRRNSISGAIECLTNQSAIELNEALHAHN
ncbi:2,3,4,5-tetrahydropyridine-2,6-dicarboxylate N-succinyltransferase [Porticoccus sp. W117]|uniref:2,3,4,5-tetrahydropyridine-2,6-dicarboxylate N-succinyltransferase n=1 Tax=Porticoccus sp. W117 TaxID=3054777 RepID=UPI002594587E|nr:2,3,4,5-tetrahydropyridine-2,6-dicarboxylate N-succinyltransferase [Porticoccus sp. W117]MDM3872221.1 2,3,4,5-tetrahydropyridine-2,6-dicarboxylate N-succinyltransferase [Porticoccus sp. W117]